MTTTHTVHSIDLDLIDAHVNTAKPAIVDLETQLNKCIPEYLIPNSCMTIDKWKQFDEILERLSELLSEHGPGYIPQIYKPVGQDYYSVLLTNPDGTVDWNTLSDKDKEQLPQMDPDYFLSSVVGAPKEKYDIAYEYWLEDVKARTPIFSQSFDVSLEARIFWVEISVDFSYAYEIMANGSVVLRCSVSGKIGAALKKRGIGVSAGLEAGAEVVLEFESRREADAFLALLQKEIRDVDLDAVAGLIGNNIDSLTVSVGVYADIEAKCPGWASAESSLSLRTGYAHDVIKNEHIWYFGANAEFKLGIPGQEVGAAVQFEGQQHWCDNGDSYVDLNISLGYSAGLEDILPGGMPLSAGAKIILSVRLELDDPTAVRAWENFMDPLDGSLDLEALLDRADVTATVVNSVQADILDIEVDAIVASGEVEVSTTTETTTDFYAKPPGGTFERVKV